MPHRRIVTLFTLATLLLPSLAAADDADLVVEAQRKRVEVVKRAAKTVVAIFGPGGGGGGSGVLVSADGYAVTNFHVTKGAGDFMKCGLNDGKLYDAVIVGIDPTGDVALIKLLGRDDFPFSKLGDSETVQVGDWAYAMGNPFLLATDFKPTVTYGIVSGVHRYQYPAGTFLEYTDCIQIDTSINPGNSGGPLFNEEGDVVGINGRGSFEKRGRVNSGAGYAISSNQVKHFLDHLKSGRVVDHATLGATVSTWDDGSVRVNNVLERSEAYRRGLRIDDEIVFFGGRPIGSVNQFKNILGIYPKGWKVPLVYRRDGKKYEVVVRLRALHRASEMMPGGGKGKPKPKPGDDGKPRIPVPGMQPGGGGPAKYKHMLVKKPGFMNYYFNEQQQKRVLAGLDPWGDFSGVDRVWTLSGKTNAGDPFTFTLADKAAGLELGPRVFYQPFDGSPLRDQPLGTGGLLVAADQMRRLVGRRDEGFTDFHYLGSEPLDGKGEKVDVIVGTRSTATTWFYFSKESGRLVGFDTEMEPDLDACEIRFGKETVEIDGRRLPSVWKLQVAGEELATLTLEKAELAGKPAED